MKSEKNRTIELTDKEYKLYLSHCLMPPNKPLVVNDVINKTFYGSMENVVPFLPAQFVDLMKMMNMFNSQTIGVQKHQGC